MELKLLEQIGEGSFGQIYKARWEDKIYAAKVIPKEKWENNLLFECVITKSFTCPYLNVAEKIFINDNYIILSELGIDFPAYREQNKFSLSIFWKWINQLLIAIYTLHSSGIIHGDIKAKNILIMPDKTLKLIDYSCSCFQYNKSVNVYTYTHRAPEVWDQDWNEQADIWAFGCTIFEMITGHLLFPAQKKPNLKERMLACIDDYFKIKNINSSTIINSSTNTIDHYSPHFDNLLDKKEYGIIKNMIEDCLVLKTNRLSSKQLLQKYFFYFPVNNFVIKSVDYPIVIDFKKYLDIENNHPIVDKILEILISRLPPKEQTPENILSVVSIIYKLLNIKSNYTNTNEDKVCFTLDFNLYFEIKKLIV